MKIKSSTQKEWDRHLKDVSKILKHFCIFPKKVEDNWNYIFLDYCYKVSCWNGHGSGGNRYFQYFENLEEAQKQVEEQTLY